MDAQGNIGYCMKYIAKLEETEKSLDSKYKEMESLIGAMSIVKDEHELEEFQKTIEPKIDELLKLRNDYINSVMVGLFRHDLTIIDANKKIEILVDQYASFKSSVTKIINKNGK